MTGERIVPSLCGSQKELGGDRRESDVFYLSGSPDPITPSLHIVVLVVVASGFIAPVCLSLAVISICPFLPSVFSSNWSPLPSLIAPLLICGSVWQAVAVSPPPVFTQPAYGSPQSSVTPATARGACKGVCLIDHRGIAH